VRKGIAILVGVIVLAGVSWGAVVSTEYLTARFSGLSPLAASAIAAAKNFVVFGAIALFGLWLSRRDVKSVGSAIAFAVDDGVEPLRRGPAWLAEITAAGATTIESLNTRLRESSQRLRELEIRHSVSDAERRHVEAILGSLKDAVLVTDTFNELTLANPSAAHVLGIDLAKSEHRDIGQLISDERLRELIDEVRQSGSVSKQKHVEHTLTPRGEQGDPPHTFDVTLACLPDQKQGVGGVVTILRDITREKEISQMKTDFVSQASHELRTPLASINAYLEMLLDAEARDEASRQEFYQIIKSEVDRICRLIDNMLNISRIEAGIVTIDREDVDFAKVVSEVVETMQPQAKTKNIMLIEKSGPLVYTASADHDMMHQVVMNLVSNAIKYTPDGGRATVTVENDDTSRSVLVTIADTGLGIPPDAIDKIFDKFYRIENYKRVAKGTGLGLNLVKHIVETVHQGKVGVTSQLGMGSKFWFSIPYEAPGA
jgi:two-component system, OmpR family, phosphate regulon sensor histidine kinase PhoR